MARPRKTKNQGLPQNLLCRTRTRANGKKVEYFYYVTADGKEKGLGRNKHFAVLEAAKLNCDRVIKTTEIITFVTVATRYQSEVIPLKAKGTQISNNVALRKILAFFGDPPAPLDKIEPHHIKQYLEWRKDFTASANNEVALFHHIWAKAREWGYTKYPCPSEGVQRYKVKFRDIYVEDNILEKLYECADQQLRDLMDVAYLTGQRPVDIVKMQHTQIVDDVLHITQQKTGAKLRIAITGKLKEIISRRVATTQIYLFHNKYGNPLTPNMLSQWFIDLRKKTIETYPEFKDEIQSVQFRDLRAKAGTDKFLSSGTESAQKQLGHTTPQMTKRYIRKDKIIQPTKP